MKKEDLQTISRILDKKIKMLTEDVNPGEAEGKETEELELHKIGVGKVITIKFQGGGERTIDIKFEKLDAKYGFWMVFDSMDSVSLKDGDIVKFVKGKNDSVSAEIIIKGKVIYLDVMRKIEPSPAYTSKPVSGWY